MVGEETRMAKDAEKSSWIFLGARMDILGTTEGAFSDCCMLAGKRKWLNLRVEVSKEERTQR